MKAVISVLFGLALAAFVIFGSGCTHCPKCAEPKIPPPQIVEVTKVCMEPLPVLPDVRLPKVAPDATEVVIDAANYRALVVFIKTLVDYTLVQRENCGLQK